MTASHTSLESSSRTERAFSRAAAVEASTEPWLLRSDTSQRTTSSGRTATTASLPSAHAWNASVWCSTSSRSSQAPATSVEGDSSSMCQVTSTMRAVSSARTR